MVQVAIMSPCVAQLNERVEKLDRGDRGIAEKLTITRAGSVVCERLQLDKDRDGKFESSVEKLSVSGQSVFTSPWYKGKLGTVVQNAENIQVNLFERVRQLATGQRIY
jgi:hypothetical protein